MGVTDIWRDVLTRLGFIAPTGQLDRARKLLQHGQLEEAVLVCREVLFSTLTFVSQSMGIAMPRQSSQEERAFALNEELFAAGLYNESRQQQIHRWISIGQLANEGALDEVTIGDVRSLVDELDAFEKLVARRIPRGPSQETPKIQPNASSGNGRRPVAPAAAVGTPAVRRRPDASPSPGRSNNREISAPGMVLPLERTQSPAVVLGTMPRVAGFVGRGPVVARLVGQLRQGRHMALVPVEAGMAGVGLSAVGAEAIWLLQQEATFKDGVVALHAFGRQGEEALRWIYDEIGLAWQVPAIAQASSLAEQERTVRRVLLGRQTLIVIDHAELGLPLQRLVDTLTSGGATLLITSRNVPGAEQVSVMRVEPLPPIPALTLFQNRFQAAGGTDDLWSEPAANAINTLVNYRPLAIELAAAYAAFTTTPVVALAQRLETARGWGSLSDRNEPNQALRYLLDLTLQRIDPLSQQRVIASAVFAGPTWSEDAALAVMGAVEATVPGNRDGSTADTLRGLVRSALVQRTVGGTGASRYRLQPFIRGVLARLLTEQPSLMDLAGHAMTTYFAGLALDRRRTADMAVMQEEYVHLEAALSWSHLHDDPERVVAIGMGLARFWQRQGLWREGTTYLQWAVRAASAIGDRPREGTLAQDLAALEASLGHKGRAREWYAYALEIWRSLANARNEAVTLFDQGQLSLGENHLEEARMDFGSSLLAAQEAGDEQGQGRALQALGLVAERLGDMAEARSRYEQVYAMREQAKDAVGQAGALNVLGVLEFRQHHYDAARDYLSASLKLALEAKNEFWEAEARFWLGEAAMAQKQYAEATREWQRALALYLHLGRGSDVEETQHRLAQVMAIQ